MKASIKAKIFFSLCMVVFIIMGMNALFFYSYFSKILKDQVVQDVQRSMKQNGAYMDYILDSIEKFAQDVSVDEQLQLFLERAPKRENVKDIERIDQMMTHLESLNHLRSYVNSAAVVTKDGEVYWTAYPFDRYFSDKLKETWYRELKGNTSPEGKFSRVHTVFTDGNVPMETISYVTNLKSVDLYGKALGKLILNIRLEYLAGIVEAQSKESAEYFLLNEEGQPLFSKNGETAEHILKDKEATSEYLVFHQKLSNGWMLTSYYSKDMVFEKIAYVYVFFTFTMLISIGMILLLILPIISGITKPVKQLSMAMQEVSKGNLRTSIQINSHDEMEQLGDGFNQMTKDLESYIFQSVQHEKDKRKMEFELLMAKINPHFIYNTLNTVVYMARKQKNYDIVEMVTSFINILQDTIRGRSLDEELFATLEKEMEILRSYLVIQNYRYKDRFEVLWEIEEGISHYVIPKNILQPLVENAIYHGISPKNEKGLIQISCKKDLVQELLIMSITDNGIGMEREKCERIFKNSGEAHQGSAMKPIGLASILERVKFFYGELGSVTVDSEEGKGTKVEVRIPYMMNVTAKADMNQLFLEKRAREDAENAEGK